VASAPTQLYTKAELRQLETKGPQPKSTDKSAQETAAALAPSEGRGEVANGEKIGLTRVPPRTAIAGQLIRLWVEGGLELVSKL
jgi:NAD+ diphosphatase